MFSNYSGVKRALVAGALAAAVAMGASAVKADIIQTATLTNFMAGDPSNPLSATITFDFSTTNSDLTITIDNSTASTLSALELIRSVGFTLQNYSGISVLNDSTTVGSEVNVAGDGSYTTSSSKDNSQLSDGWNYVAGTSDLITASGSKDLVIGPPGAGGKYTGNGSINGNPGHDPFLASGAVFTIDLPNITAGTQVLPGSNITIGYGTGTDTITDPIFPNGTPTPEPATMGMLAVGGLGLLLGRRKHA